MATRPVTLRSKLSARRPPEIPHRTMFDSIDSSSPVPLYEQIASRLRMAVASAEVEPGDALPSVRDLASRIRVNPATVVQAYRQLEADGFVTTRRGSGTFVSEVPVERRREELEEQARALVRDLLEKAGRMGIDVDQLTAALREQLGEKLLGETLHG